MKLILKIVSIGFKSSLRFLKYHLQISASIQSFDKRITSIDFGYKNSLMLKPFRPLKLEKVQHLFDHVVDQGNKYGWKHVADFDFLNFKEVNADGHDQYAADPGHLIDDSGN